MAGVISSSLSWSYFENNAGSPCVVLTATAWYTALVLSISAIAVASQQLVAIHRLSTYPNGLGLIRNLLAGNFESAQQQAVSEESPEGPTTGLRRIRASQAYLWQIPVMLLNSSLYIYTAGLTILVYWHVTQLLPLPGSWVVTVSTIV